MKSGSKRDMILKVACKLVRERGASQLTLDAVAKEAGISKGGLLYHFPSKNALIQAILADFLDRFDLGTEEEALTNSSLNNQWTQSYLIECFEISKEDLELSAGILAAAANNPELLEPMRERYRVWQSRMQAESADPIQATVARLAADGMFFCELFGFAPLEPEMRSSVLRYLTKMVES